MFELFHTSGPFIMGTLTLLLIIVIILATRSLLRFFRQNGDANLLRNDLSLIKSIGILSIVLGILGQLIGLFSAFSSIEAMGSISPNLLVAGLKASLITTIYGTGIMILTFGLSIGLETYLNQEKPADL